MFSSGQLVFAACFIVVFVVAMAFAYRKDKGMHQQFFSGGTRNILLAFLLFVLLMFAMKFLLKH